MLSSLFPSGRVSSSTRDDFYVSFGIFLLRNVFLLCFAHSDYLFKLLLIGDSGVGKSCLLLRFAVGIRIFLFFLRDVLPNKPCVGFRSTLMSDRLPVLLFSRVDVNLCCFSLPFTG